MDNGETEEGNRIYNRKLASGESVEPIPLNRINKAKQMKITDERWETAQQAERECHDRFLNKDGQEFVKNHYAQTYANYFHYLDITQDQTDKTIVEIGCADFPALEYCHDLKRGWLVEPLPSEILVELAERREDLIIIQNKVEEIELPESDEIWLLNVLQHVQDPDLFIEKCKASTKVIKFFEPIDWPVEIYHPHTFDFDYFKGHFPEAKRYEGTDKGFHTAHCAFGSWTK